MTARLTLVCHAPTAATRTARFPHPDDSAAPVSTVHAPRVGRILAAPERRARETAAALGLDPDVDDALRDQDFGRWTGQALSDIATAEPEAFATWTIDPEAAPHGGESITALVRRVEAWMAARAAAGGRILGVTHPAVVRAVVVAALRTSEAAFWRIDAPPRAEVRLSHDGRRWTLTALVPP